MSRPVLLFDLETCGLPDVAQWVPEPEAAPEPAPLDPPRMSRAIKKPDSIAQWEASLPALIEIQRAEQLAGHAQKRVEQLAAHARKLERAALDPHLARIVVLGYALDHDDPTCLVCRTEDDERSALTAFWLHQSMTWMERAHGIGSVPNIVGWFVRFDLRMAVIRSRYLRVRVPDIDLHPYTSRSYLDLMDVFALPQLGRREDGVMSLSCETVYTRLGGPALNDSITGAEVPACIMAGDYTQPEAHNRADLTRLRWIAEWLGVSARQPVSA